VIMERIVRKGGGETKEGGRGLTRKSSGDVEGHSSMKEEKGLSYRGGDRVYSATLPGRGGGHKRPNAKGNSCEGGRKIHRGESLEVAKYGSDA